MSRELMQLVARQTPQFCGSNTSVCSDFDPTEQLETVNATDREETDREMYNSEKESRNSRTSETTEEAKRARLT